MKTDPKLKNSKEQTMSSRSQTPHFSKKADKNTLNKQLLCNLTVEDRKIISIQMVKEQIKKITYT